MAHRSSPTSSAFEPTVPATTPGWTATHASGVDDDSGPSTLSPSLLSDLRRFADDPLEAELLPVVAASARHNSPLSLTLALAGRLFTLHLDPARQVYSCEVDICALTDQSLAQLRLVHVQSAAAQPSPTGAAQRIGSMRPLLWHLALRGCQQDLLPELAGPVRCRMTKALSLTGLPVDGATKRLMLLMSGAPVALEDLLPETQLSRFAVQRIWNALYLQSALMVSRAYPH